MASPTLRAYYRAERKNPRSFRVGFSAVDAYSTALTRIKFEALEALDLVRLDVQPDDCPDLSFLDTWDDSRGSQASAKAIRATASEEGVFGIVGEYRLDADSPWQTADSVWGFIGYDDANPARNCYTPDIQSATLDAFRTAWKDHVNGRCLACHGTGRAA